MKRLSTFVFVAFAGCLVMASCGSKTGKTSKSGREKNVNLDPVFLTTKDNVFLIGSEEAGFQGTAFLIDYKDKKYLVTNFHVISLLKKKFVETQSKVAYKGVEVLAVDRQHDVSILEAKALPKSIKGLHYTHNFETSQKIYVVGYPDMRSQENHLNFGTGVISDASYMAPFLMGQGEGKNIQITAPINPGHSGSPVLNERAEVIGVVSWRFSAKADLQGGNYAVPFQYVSALLTEIENRQHEISQLYPEGNTCSDDDECQWLYFCIDGKCQTLRNQGESCSVHDDCFLPYNCFNKVCSRMGSLGDTCQNDSQCVPPNYCIIGTCRPLGQKNDACKYDMDCVAPLYCIAGKCVKELSGKNGPCTQNIDCNPPLSCISGKCQESQGKTCASDHECTPLYCILGTCRDLGGDGGTCGMTIDCKTGLKCVSGICKTQSLSALGGPCSTDYNCQMPWYCIGGQCKDAGAIAKSSTQGSPCTSDVQCQPPLYCILSTCRPLGNHGDACSTDVDCNMPLYCISAVCSYKSGITPGMSTVQGTPCTSDSQCQSPLYCILGTCRPLGISGDPCSYDGDCQSPLYCVGGICSSTTPQQSTVHGSPCTNDSQCAHPLYCIVNVCQPLGNISDPCTYDYDCNVPYICTGGACAQPGYGGPVPGVGGAGSSTPGTVCNSDADCAPPLYCILQSCRPLGKLGDSCAIDADCSMPYICKNSKCKNPGGTLSTPTTGPDKTSKPEMECTKDKECKKKGKGFKYCIANKCKKSLSKTGEACQYTTDCKKGLFCIVGICRKEQSGRGEPCRSNDDCKRPYLCKNFICTD